MGTSIHPTKCCAVQEIDNLSLSKGPEEALLSLGRNAFLKRHYWESWYAPFAIFTGVVERAIADHASGREDDYGQAFADYIVANNLGTIIASEPRRNSSNVVRVWIWHVNHDAYKKWFDKYPEPKVLEEEEF